MCFKPYVKPFTFTVYPFRFYPFFPFFRVFPVYGFPVPFRFPFKGRFKIPGNFTGTGRVRDGFNGVYPGTVTRFSLPFYGTGFYVFTGLNG